MMEKKHLFFVCLCFITMFSCTDDMVDINASDKSLGIDNLCESGFIEVPGGSIAEEIPSEIFYKIIDDLKTKSEYLKIEKIKSNYILDNNNYILNKRLSNSNATRTLTDFAIEYRSHVGDDGWTAYSKMGEVTGTTGQQKRLEAIQFRYTNHIIPIYDFKVRVHVRDYGWLPWVVIGDIAGMTGMEKRLEAIQINVSSSYNIYYRTHVAGKGWLPYVFNNEISGTVGEERRIEAFQLFVFKY